MRKRRRSGFGHGEPRYHLAFNPYPSQRFTKCPHCRANTGQRKLPLLIHIDQAQMVALNYTNRYCKHCDLLIAHKDEVESLLTDLFASAAPELVGNDYLIFATMEKNAWRDNMHSPRAPMEMLDHIHDFKSYTELRMTRGGWYPEGVEPPEWTPPASERWVKEK